ncbi:MAG TPA: radical SAM/SPASM domain-containing protein [Bryobacteraceae bacterium]|nr:radical SAM/SPASM domain-containing protein [Bryobacteraceae bacterium]
MLSVLFHHFVPASLYGGETVFPALTRIDRELRDCQHAESALGILERAKPELYTRLRARFATPVAQALTLKILNLVLARYHFQARSASVVSRPYGLVIDPSNMCQLACPGCVHSTRNEELKVFDWPKGTLSEDRLSALLKLYGPHAIGVYFCNYGEPLLNLNTPKLIRLAKTYLMGTALSTSLSISRLDAEAYVESGLDFMVLSIDGATQPVYEQFRRNGDLELVFTNVRKLVNAKRRLGKRTPVLSWNFLAFEHNAHEIPLAARMARQLGVNHFRVVNPFDIGWDDPEIRPAAVKGGVRRLDWLSMAGQPENWNPFPDSVDASTIARAFENPWNQQTAGDAPPSSGHTCHWLYKNMVMDATGRIMPCCGGPRPDTNLVFGTFSDNGTDPFNSEKYRQARAWFSGDTPPSDDAPHCTKCEWDQTTVNIGSPEIRRYFRAADAAFFDRRSLDILSGW